MFGTLCVSHFVILIGPFLGQCVLHLVLLIGPFLGIFIGPFLRQCACYASDALFVHFWDSV